MIILQKDPMRVKNMNTRQILLEVWRYAAPIIVLKLYYEACSFLILTQEYDFYTGRKVWKDCLEEWAHGLGGLVHQSAL
jgi:hypothetical protein